MEDIPWVLYALLSALLVTQVILIVMAAERHPPPLIEIKEAINSQTRALLAVLKDILYKPS